MDGFSFWERNASLRLAMAPLLPFAGRGEQRGAGAAAAVGQRRGECRPPLAASRPFPTFRR